MECYVTDFNVSKPGAAALEDSIMKKGNLTTAGSKMLGSFTAPFDATVVERLQAANVEISGKTRMDEFGIGGFFNNSRSGLSGAVQAVNSNAASCCLCNDLFGRYRKESAENGLCYIHPTYGTTSRYGLVPLASSMDQIGVLCRDLADGFSTLAIIAGHDPRDGAMFKDEKYSYKAAEKGLTVCAPSHIISRSDAQTQEAIRAFTKNLAVVDKPIGHFDVCKQTMYVLCCAEISNNISRYDGIKFGYRSPNAKNLDSLYTNTRTEGFETETKLAAIMGAMVLSAGKYVPYYEKAMKIRRLIKESLNFDKYDVIVLPASIGDDPYENLSLYAIAALSGFPTVSFSYNGCGIQLIANVKNENALLAAWEVSRR